MLPISLVILDITNENKPEKTFKNVINSFYKFPKIYDNR